MIALLAGGENAEFSRLIGRAQQSGLVDVDGYATLVASNGLRGRVRYCAGVNPTDVSTDVRSALWGAVSVLERLRARPGEDRPE